MCFQGISYRGKKKGSLKHVLKVKQVLKCFCRAEALRLGLILSEGSGWVFPMHGVEELWVLVTK